MSTQHPSNTSIIIVLPHGRPVRQELYERIRAVLCEIVPGMYSGYGYTLEQLCGPDLWAEFSRGQRIRAGHCASHLAKTGRVPLVRVTPPNVYPTRYRRK